MTTRRLLQRVALIGARGPSSLLAATCVQVVLAACLLFFASGLHAQDSAGFFRERIAPLLRQRCLACHDDAERSGGLSLQTRESWEQGGDNGEAIQVGDAARSYLIELVTPSDGYAEMPQDSDPLGPSEIADLRAWIDEGAYWPEAFDLHAQPAVTDDSWWAFEPLARPPVPAIDGPLQDRVKNPIDAFVFAELEKHELSPSGEADRRTLIRRVYFDLIGLPPDPREVDQFVTDPDPLAYDMLVERLLQSPHYGERWARHWLDVAHYGDTHGYDKDKPRPNAWPYRDYVIRSFQSDKPYSQFVREQIAGDVLHPFQPESIEAVGFLAAGPWDFISHVEVSEDKIDGQIARHLDRDDFVRTTMETFNSITIGCARCHEHKFDPFSQKDYYQLQAVFAAIDRADRAYDRDPEVARQRAALADREQALVAELREHRQQISTAAGPQLAKLDTELAARQNQVDAGQSPQFGYHSQLEPTSDSTKWVQVDLGDSRSVESIELVGCFDDFNNIGAGFGFPLRFKIESSADETFGSGVRVIADQTAGDFPNPGTDPVHFATGGRVDRYVRVTATKLAARQNDFMFALAELRATAENGTNAALGAAVTAMDSIEMPVRWGKENLVDGRFFGDNDTEALKEQLAKMTLQREKLLDERVPQQMLEEGRLLEDTLAQLVSEIEELPEPSYVYAACTDFVAEGSHMPTGGKPREIHLLRRGNVQQPAETMRPASLARLQNVVTPFDLPRDSSEGQRRVALANWLAHPDHPLTWRSIANRIWLWHFGRGLVDTPNDFGRMGQLPSHPQLLDYLACELLDNGQSVKHLHRLICTSSTYRQSSADRVEISEVDGGNRLLWRMNRRRLDAESIRDAILTVSGCLDRTRFGPPFLDYVIEKPEHSPHYQYHLFDVNDPASHRRSIYRSIVRSQPQPMMAALDCADPSMSIPKRDETIGAQHALTMLNNRLVIAMSENFAHRLASESEELDQQVIVAFREVLLRHPSDAELSWLLEFSEAQGLPSLCRALLNLNEFVYID